MVVHGDQCVQQFGRHAGKTLSQGLNSQRKRQPDNAQRQKSPHGDRVAAEQILLQRQYLAFGDALVRELAETGVDAINRLIAREPLDEHITRANDIFAGRRSQLKFVNFPVQKALGIGERQSIAGEFQHG